MACGAGITAAALPMSRRRPLRLQRRRRRPHTERAPIESGLMPLFEAGRHEALTETAWNEARARSAISRIVADTNADCTAGGLWPIHPADRSPERPPDHMKMLYNGAAGV